MSRLRRLGGLAYLARCPSTGAAAVPSDAHGALGGTASLHAAGFPGPASSRRHNSTRADPLHDDLTVAPGPSSCSATPTSASAANDSSIISSIISTPTADTNWPTSSCPCPSHSLVAASPLDDSLAFVLSPVQLGVQLWEGTHTASGLPWWASIPAATLALRTALLPLSLRAYAASANVALLHQAFGASRAVAEAVAEAARQRQRQRQRERDQRGEEGDAQRLASGGSSSSSSDACGSGGGGGAAGAAAAVEEAGPVELRRLDLVRRVFAHLRVQNGAPSFGWYLGNAAVQAPLLVSLSLALRRMSDSLWPGFTGEGALYFPDLTSPPVYLQTLSTPYGTAGAILPLALVLLYMTAAEKSAGGSSPGILLALKLLVLPLYCSALLQPHAVLLYWLTHAASQLGVYQLAGGVPALRRAAGVPEMLTATGPTAATATGPTATRSGDAAAGAGEATDAAAGELDELLLALSESYGKSGNAAAARACVDAVLVRQPDHEAAGERLRALAAAAAAAAAAGSRHS